MTVHPNTLIPLRPGDPHIFSKGLNLEERDNILLVDELITKAYEKKIPRNQPGNNKKTDS